MGQVYSVMGLAIGPPSGGPFVFSLFGTRDGKKNNWNKYFLFSFSFPFNNNKFNNFAIIPIIRFERV